MAALVVLFPMARRVILLLAAMPSPSPRPGYPVRLELADPADPADPPAGDSAAT